MYGGLGKVGLDYQGKKRPENALGEQEEEPDPLADENEDEYVVPAFSGSAKQLIRNHLAQKGEDEDEDQDSDEEMLAEGFDEMM